MGAREDVGDDLLLLLGVLVFVLVVVDAVVVWRPPSRVGAVVGDVGLAAVVVEVVVVVLVLLALVLGLLVLGVTSVVMMLLVLIVTSVVLVLLVVVLVLVLTPGARLRPDGGGPCSCPPLRRGPRGGCGPCSCPPFRRGATRGTPLRHDVGDDVVLLVALALLRRVVLCEQAARLHYP